MLTFFDPLYGTMWRDVERMRHQVDAMLEGWGGGGALQETLSGGFPAVNVGLSDERVDVYLFAPGLDRDSIEASLQDNFLTVSGERKLALPQDVQLRRNERFQGRFRRILSLPKDVDRDQVSATYRDGVLHIQVGRRPQAKPNRIQIQ